MPTWFIALFAGLFILALFYNGLTIWMIYYLKAKHRESAKAAGLPVSIFDMSIRNGIALFSFFSMESVNYFV